MNELSLLFQGILLGLVLLYLVTIGFVLFFNLWIPIGSELNGALSPQLISLYEVTSNQESIDLSKEIASGQLQLSVKGQNILIFRRTSKFWVIWTSLIFKHWQLIQFFLTSHRTNWKCLRLPLTSRPPVYSLCLESATLALISYNHGGLENKALRQGSQDHFFHWRFSGLKTKGTVREPTFVDTPCKIQNLLQFLQQPFEAGANIPILTETEA